MAALLVATALPAAAVEDLRTLQVLAQRGQSQDQTRRDRYECHNWAVEQTGQGPVAVGEPRDPHDDKRELRRERAGRAVVGATIGGALGGLLGDRRHASDRALAGVAAGAAIGAATAGAGRAAAAEPEEQSDYLRALTACLEGRGYAVSLPRVGD